MQLVHSVFASARRFSLGVLSISILLTFVGNASAAPITVVPTGLNFGDQYRLAFITSTVGDAASSDIADYNAFVTALATTVPELDALDTTWTAIASTATVDARENTNTNVTVEAGVPIYRLDDELVANDNADLWDGSIAIRLGVTESGVCCHNVTWTGTTSDGLKFAEHFLGTPFPRRGAGSQTNSLWISADNVIGGSLNNRFYAISGTLTAPEPGTAALLAMGLVALAGVRRRNV